MLLLRQPEAIRFLLHLTARRISDARGADGWWPVTGGRGLVAGDAPCAVHGSLSLEHAGELGAPISRSLDMDGNEWLLGGGGEGEGVPFEESDAGAAYHDVLACHGSETPGLAELHLQDVCRQAARLQQPDVPVIVPPAPHDAFCEVDEDGQAHPHPCVTDQPLVVLIGDGRPGVQNEGHIENDEQVVRACVQHMDI